MPTYEYACTTCGMHIDVFQSFAEAPLTTCASCGGDLRKVFSPVGIAFKGTGFYRNDSRASVGVSKAGAVKDSGPGSGDGGPAGPGSGSGDGGSAGSGSGDGGPAGSGSGPAKAGGTNGRSTRGGDSSSGGSNGSVSKTPGTRSSESGTKSAISK